MTMLPRVCLFALSILLYLPVSLSCQEAQIETRLMLQGSAYMYGGMMFAIEISNGTNDTIVFHDTNDDGAVLFTGDGGRSYRSAKPWESRISPILITPKTTHRTEFEIENLGITFRTFDNEWYGPVFEPGEYTVYDTLKLSTVRNTSPAGIHVAKTRIQVVKSPESDAIILDRMHDRFRGIAEAYLNMVCNQGSEETLEFRIREMTRLADSMKTSRLYRRIRQAEITFGLNDLAEDLIGHLRIEGIDRLKELIAGRAREYLLLYPDKPFAKKCQRYLQQFEK